MEGDIKPVTILVAHHERLSCESLVQALSQPPHSFDAQGVVGTADRILEMMETNRPQVAIVNSSLEGGTSAALNSLREINRRFPETHTVLIADNQQEELIVEAFRAGVTGVLHTQDGLDSAVECVRTVASGDMWAGKTELRALRGAISLTSGAVHIVNSQGAQLLSPRQKELVELVAGGLTNKEIAEQMKLSEHTVKNYLFRIFDKLGVSSRAELIIYTLNRRSI